MNKTSKGKCNKSKKVVTVKRKTVLSHHKAHKTPCHYHGVKDTCSVEPSPQKGLPEIELSTIMQDYQKIVDSKVIGKLPNHKGVKLSSTLSGQRELIREMRNTINELVEKVNQLWDNRK